MAIRRYCQTTTLNAVSLIDASQPLAEVQREISVALEAFWFSSEESG